MARSGYRRLNIEYDADALRILDLYCINGIGGLTPTAIMRGLLAEFIRQISAHLNEGATTQVVDATIPIVVETVRNRLERTGDPTGKFDRMSFAQQQSDIGKANASIPGTISHAITNDL